MKSLQAHSKALQLDIPVLVQESMAQEGQELAKASFGPTILMTIGKAYEAQAAIYLGGFIQGGIASFKQETHSIKSKVTPEPVTEFQPCLQVQVISLQASS